MSEGATTAQVSMSATSNPDDNATTESVFKTLEREEVSLNQYEFAAAEAQRGRLIDAMYNRTGLHTSLGDPPPPAYERLAKACERSPVTSGPVRCVQCTAVRAAQCEQW